MCTVKIAVLLHAASTTNTPPVVWWVAVLCGRRNMCLIESLSSSLCAQEYDVLGLGQLMIDYAATVDDDMLAALDVPKGGRR